MIFLLGNFDFLLIIDYFTVAGDSETR